MNEELEKEETLPAALETIHPPAPPAPGIHQGKELEEIFQQHSRRIYLAAYRVTGSRSDAEDVLQTVFLRLARRKGELALADGAGTYLHRAAVNGALDLLRSRRRRATLPLDEVETEVSDSATAGPERDRFGQELREGLRRALTKVTPRAAEIFALRYFEDLANAEIAKMLEISATSVAVTLHRVRGRLQEELLPLAGGMS